MNKLVSSDMKINYCTTSVNHKLSLFIVIVYDLLQLCHFTADISDENTFLQMSHLSEITSGIVSEHARHVSTLDDRLDIFEGLHGLKIA